MRADNFELGGAISNCRAAGRDCRPATGDWRSATVKCASINDDWRPAADKNRAPNVKCRSANVDCTSATGDCKPDFWRRGEKFSAVLFLFAAGAVSAKLMSRPGEIGRCWKNH